MKKNVPSLVKFLLKEEQVKIDHVYLLKRLISVDLNVQVDGFVLGKGATRASPSATLIKLD